MRLVFLGTPAAAVPTLFALVEAGHEVVGVVTRPDRRRGRRGAPAPSPVKAAALDLGLEVHEDLGAVTELGADLGVVVAYGRLVPARVLDALELVNVHFSLLPRWRGAAPVERAILAGDDVTGVCLMRLEVDLDTGPLYACRPVPIDPSESAEGLRGRLAVLGADMMVELLAEAKGPSGLPEPVPQEGAPTYAEKVRPEELELDWAAPAEVLARLARLGRAFTTFGGRRLRVLKARPSASLTPPGAAPGTLTDEGVVTGGGALALIEVQPESGRAMGWSEWRRGARPGPGARLGT